MTFDNTLTLKLYTEIPYILQQDTLECYIDYNTPYLRLRTVDGSPHGLTNLDMGFI